MTTTVPKIKLTKVMREEFVASVLAEIKTGVDNDLIRVMVTDEALAALPTVVRAIYRDKDLAHYVHLTRIQFDSAYCATRKDTRGYNYSQPVSAHSVMVPGAEDFKLSADLRTKVCNMLEAEATLLDEKHAMKERLTAMAGACKNTEELEDMFPLLTKYIPKPVILPRSMVPAVQIKDTMKALRKLGVPPKAVATGAPA